MAKKLQRLKLIITCQQGLCVFFIGVDKLSLSIKPNDVFGKGIPGSKIFRVTCEETFCNRV